MKNIDKLAEKLSELKFQIKLKQLELLKVKEDLTKEMILNSENKKDTKYGQIRLVEYKSKYSPYLKKEFDALNQEQKNELYKTGLLKISFRLNVKKFNELNEKDKEVLQKFVRDKTEGSVNLYFKLNQQAMEEIKQVENSIFSESEISKKILNELEEERNEIEEFESELVKEDLESMRSHD